VLDILSAIIILEIIAREMVMITIYSMVGDRVKENDKFGTVIEKIQNAHDSYHFIFRIRWDSEFEDDSFRSRWC
jgi:hypothetical protein